MFKVGLAAALALAAAVALLQGPDRGGAARGSTASRGLPHPLLVSAGLTDALGPLATLVTAAPGRVLASSELPLPPGAFPVARLGGIVTVNAEATSTAATTIYQLRSRKGT